MHVSCTSCGQSLVIDDQRVPAHPFSVRCPKCQTELKLPGAARPPAAPAPQPAAEPPPDPAASRGTGRDALEALLRVMVESKASDLHLSVGCQPMLRHDGEMTARRRPACPDRGADTERMLLAIAPPRNREEFERRHDTDFAYEIAGRRPLPVQPLHGSQGHRRRVPHHPATRSSPPRRWACRRRSWSSATCRRAWCSSRARPGRASRPRCAR